MDANDTADIPTTTDPVPIGAHVHATVAGSDLERATYMLTKNPVLVELVLLPVMYSTECSYFFEETNKLRNRIINQWMNKKKDVERDKNRDYRKESRERVFQTLKIIGFVVIITLLFLWSIAMAYTCTVHGLQTWIFATFMYTAFISAIYDTYYMDQINNNKNWTKDHKVTADRLRNSYLICSFITILSTSVTCLGFPRSFGGVFESITIIAFLCIVGSIIVGAMFSIPIMFMDVTIKDVKAKLQ